MKSLFRITILIVCSALAGISTMDLHAEEDSKFAILAILDTSDPTSPYLVDKRERLAWQIDPEVLSELSKMTVIRPQEAKEIGEAFLSAALKGNKNKKECCYKKVADGVWSCCDGTFVTTTTASLREVFRLSEEASGTTAGKRVLSAKVKALIEKVRRPNSLTPVPERDERLRAVWMKLSDVKA